ncbi:ankyrin repeat-containing protein ITN1-like [Herrania umbratica]|uniref:Ankyrin repeat-containing protein ITN1-like n=1 Tax=Herrania umbratica TaxID=108875 RepID=A0A6J1BBD2_9ROSI|nr:ankyrin repeat-containing protein ITN1-like [Herrania umbratica]
MGTKCWASFGRNGGRRIENLLIDQIPFVDTPLHLAAKTGHVEFAMEMMNLKPSFARKLNQDGLSPIHLALAYEQKEMVDLLLASDKDLARVKGKEGNTPLHYATKHGNLPLLAQFLIVCPECIEDTTTRDETALHIAVQAIDSTLLNMDILQEQSQVDIKECIEILYSARGLNASSIPPAPPLQDKLRSKLTFHEKLFGEAFREIFDISIEQSNALLVILVLILTATYQATLSPPGGLGQGGSGGNNGSIGADAAHQLRKSIMEDPTSNLGKSSMSSTSFLLFFIPNTIAFLLTTVFNT